jgi:hemoglobin/transferrin/lactoferrin receptor protein
MRKYFLLILFFPLLASAQLISISNGISGNPISDVYLYCEAGSAVSNEKGQALITHMKDCKVIKFQHPAFSALQLTYQELAAQNFSINLKENQYALEAVQLNFNKWEQEQAEVPIKIEQIDQKEIQTLNPQTAADLLEASGGVFIQKSQLGGGSPMIRGFSTSRVLLVVDGVRMNTAIFREGNVQNVISLDANSIQHTEILYGPGSVVYGSDAIGGVMDFHTLEPRYSHTDKTISKTNLLLRTNTANFEKTAHVDFNIGTKKLAWLSSFTFSDYDNLIMGTDGPDEYLRPIYQTRINGRDTILNNPNSREQISTGYSQFNSTQKLRYRPMANLDLVYSWHYSKSSDVPRYDRLTQSDGADGLRNAEWHYGPQLWQMHNLNATYFKRTPFFSSAKAVVAYQQFEESRVDRRFNNDTRRIRTEQVDAYSLSLDFERNAWNGATLYYGVDAVYNAVGSEGIGVNINTGESVSVASRYPDGSSWSSQALYANLKQELGTKLYLMGGVRANLVQLRGELDNAFYDFPFTSIDQNFRALNGSVGLTYLPTQNTQLSLNLSNGFRAPNIDDAAKIFDSGDAIVVVPNTTLQPEYLYAADIGFIQKIGGLRAELNGYFSYLDNALVRSPFSFNGQDSIEYDGELSQVQALQNTASAIVYGAQVSLAYTFASYWNVRSSYHFNTGETNEGDALRHVAPNFGQLAFRYENKRLMGQLRFRFNQAIAFSNLAPSEQEKPELYAMDADGNPFSPAWQTLDFIAAYQITDALRLQLNANNLFDQRYRPYSSGIAAAGRNFGLSIRASF